MKPIQVLELVRLADPVPAGAEGPSGFLSRAALLERIDERSTGMQTEQRAGAEWTKESRSRRLIPMLAGAAAVMAAIVVAVSLISDGADVASPLEVGEALNRAAVDGDWETVRSLYADDATWADEFDSRGVLDPYRGEPIYARFDWDQDGEHSVLDSITDEIMANYAAGMSTYHTCVERDTTTVVCRVLVEDSAFVGLSVPNDVETFTNTYTVVDGLVTRHESFWGDFAFVILEAMRPARIDYHDWVRANRPELNVDDSLFQALGRPLISPETVEIHRPLIQEWRAQR